MESKTPELKNSLEDLEVKIEKFPYAESPLLIDEFYIMGYTDIICKEKIINPTISNINTTDDISKYYNLMELQIAHLPTALSMISSETNIRRVDIEHLINYAFPVPPKIFYYIDKIGYSIKEPDTYNIIFNNINNETICNGYVYCFYEKQIIEVQKGLNIQFYIPKFFIIISQYNYFYSFYKICKYIHEQFLRDNNEIPLEIQIYNIVNFLPCPLNSKIELSIYALNGVLNCKNFDEFKNLEKDNKDNMIILDQLGAFRHSEINFGKIFEICNPELIIKILILILSDAKIAFFHENFETLSYVIYFFYQITFPITPLENIYCFSPNMYYYWDVDPQDYATGFPCSLDKIKDFDPEKNFLIFEKEKETLRKDNEPNKLQYTIVDLKNGTIKFYSSDEDNDFDEDEKSAKKKDGEPTYSEEEQIKIDIYKFLSELFKNPDNYLNVGLNEIIYELYKKLETLEALIKEKKYFSYFIENEDINKLSLEVQEAFLRFIILFYNEYFKVYGKDKEKKENEKDKKEEQITLSDIELKVYSNFINTQFCNIVENIREFYNKKEPIFMKATKKNFVNMMSICNADDVNKIVFKGHFIDFLNCIFFKKQNILKENISFYEFYKYYNEKMKKNIFHLASDDIFDKKAIKNEKGISYYYKYKTINLSKNLLLKYYLYLSELDTETKNRIFPKQVQMKSILYSKDINNSIDDYLITYKLLTFKNLIQFCVLSIVILSTSELKLMAFTGPIYDLFSKMNLQIRKYVELILNVSYRFLSNKSDITSEDEINKYFNIYHKGIDEKNLYSNDELYLLNNKFKELIAQKKERCDIKPNEQTNKILNTSEESLFQLTPNSLDGEDFDDILKEGTINKKLTITGDMLEKKEINNEFIYYPLTLFKKLNDLVYKFYTNLDLEKDREEYYKLIVNTMLYVRIKKNEFPENTLKFLYHCLIKDKEPYIKEKALSKKDDYINNTPQGETK